MGPKTGFYKGLKQGCQHWMRVHGVRNARAVRCQPIKSRKSQKTWWAGGTPTLFFSDLKIFASILQTHSRGTLRTSQTSDKQQQQKNPTFFFVGREILAYQHESVRMWWNAWDSRSMRESWQLWLKTLLKIEEARLIFFFLLSCLWCKMMFRGINKQPGIQKFWNWCGHYTKICKLNITIK